MGPRLGPRGVAAVLLLLAGCPAGGGDQETDGSTAGSTAGSADSGSGGPGTTHAPPSGTEADAETAGPCLPGDLGCPCLLGGLCDAGLVCTDEICVAFVPECGNGVVEGDEQCDAGDELHDEGACKTDCTLTSCGDGFVGPGEACDDGNLVDHDGCSNACVPASCGDGILHDGEACDDANSEDGDACTNACTEASCGDGIEWVGREQCDDGNATASDACTNACNEARCGDGIEWAGEEQCDDGNASNSDACTNDCNDADCGDGYRWSGVEDCDGANLGGATCVSEGFEGGTLGCTAGCAYDTSSCTPAPAAGGP